MNLDYSKTINEQLGTFNYYRNRYASYELELMRNMQQITQLTSNWNELEEWIRSLIDDNNNRYELYKDDKLHYEYEISNIKYQNNMLVAFLDKMKEIKERK